MISDPLKSKFLQQSNRRRRQCRRHSRHSRCRHCRRLLLEQFPKFFKIEKKLCMEIEVMLYNNIIILFIST
jgi:hypothetical protein